MPVIRAESRPSDEIFILLADFRVVIGSNQRISDLVSTENAVRACVVVWNGHWAKKPVVRELRS